MLISINLSIVAGLVIFGSLGIPVISSDETNSNPVTLVAFSTLSIEQLNSAQTWLSLLAPDISFFKMQFAFLFKNISLSFSKLTSILIEYPFFIFSMTNEEKIKDIIFPDFLKWLICLKDIFLFNFSFILFSFPFIHVTSLFDDTLFNTNISLYPLNTVVSGIIILVFSKVPSNSHLISTLSFFEELGSLHVAISPVTNVILNINSFCISSNGFPSIINIPFSFASVVLIDVALNSGIFTSSFTSSISPKAINISVLFGFFNFGSSGILDISSESSISIPNNSSFTVSKLFLTSQSKIIGFLNLEIVISSGTLQTASDLFVSKPNSKFILTIIL